MADCSTLNLSLQYYGMVTFVGGEEGVESPAIGVQEEGKGGTGSGNCDGHESHVLMISKDIEDFIDNQIIKEKCIWWKRIRY